MLTQLVDLLETKENGLSLAEISRLMKVQPSALLSMIELLVRKGKLLEIGPDNQCCTTCGSQSDCNLLAARGKRYVAYRHGGEGVLPDEAISFR
jgi:predicted Zn-ribbon and HTH transcriptional regulator